MQRTRTRPVILIVEDYADTRQMMKLLLEDQDYDVLTAANGEEAISTAVNNDIDLILTDFSLPDMTGPNMVRRIRRLRNHLEDIPIVMLTAFDGRQYRELAEQAGCNAFFVKPPDFDFLRQTVDQLLEESMAELVRV
jgi:CheY-like chemotaxis protein